MIVFSYTEHRAYTPIRYRHVMRARNFACLLHNEGLFRNILIAWIAAAVIIYLTASYILFGFGAVLQQKSFMMNNLIESNTITALNVQQEQSTFTKNNQGILESMQKIAEIRYVLPADTVISRADGSNQHHQ